MSWENTLKKITPETALTAASLWIDIPSNLKLINNQINCVYRFEFKAYGYYLRITPEKIRTRAELEGAIDFQQHLFMKHAPICEAIPSKTGQFIETISQKDLEFFAHVCREVPGTPMTFDYMDKEAYFAWGKSLAQLHLASKSYQPNAHQFLTWKNLLQETKEFAQQEPQDIRETYGRIEAWFNQNPISELTYGLTHGDHRTGNVLYDGKKVHLIDFDEPVYHWFMADIARPCLELGTRPKESWKPLFDWYIEGYRSIRPLSEHDLKTINWYIQMKSLDIYLWCKNSWSEPTAPGGKSRKQWLTELRKMAIISLF